MKPADLTDPFLRAAAVDALPAIEAYVQSLKEVSGDLRILEEYLERNTIRIEVFVDVPEGLHAEQIGWTKGEGHWRIRHFSKVSTSFRPLIDLKASVRIRCQKALPALLRELAKAVSL